MPYAYSPHRPHKKRSKKAFFVWILLLGMMLGGAASVWSLVGDLPNPERLSERTVIESTRIYDRTGKVLLYEIHGEERRTVLPLAEIPDIIKQTTLAAEDINFYHHSGLDWRGIARAVWKNLSSGDFSQGGSTITQQLIKNSILGAEKTIRRKLREQILALLLERKYSKDEIFEFYLNQIPYGSNAYGIFAAAKLYFDKDVGELTLAEAAALAALLKAPTYYSPHGSHRDELISRKDWILQRMADAGFISPQAANDARKTDLSFAPPKESIRAPHFVQYVREYLNQKYGEEFVGRGGLKVISTLDWSWQQQAEKIVREGAESNQKLVEAYNAALVAVDPRTGELLAMAGSRDYFGKPLPEGCDPGIDCKFDPYVNIATRARQPGSAFKPFVYATAFKKGYTPETVLFDVPTEFNPLCNPDGTPSSLISDPKQCYHPQDYDGKFRGPVSARQALAQSLNVPSVKILYLAGVNDSIKTASDMGITTLTDPNRYGLSLVLGGAEVKLLEMTSAFGVFAQEGIRRPTQAVLRVQTRDGAVVEEKRDSAEPVLDTEIARLTNDLLSDNEARVPVFSPRSSLYFPERRVAAKTGTTQDFRDAWTIGYTPSLVVGVWVGNSDNSPMNQRGLSVMVAGPLWHKFMEAALSAKPPEDFTPPEGRIAANPVLRGSYRSGPTVKIDKISGKLATPHTPPELIEEVTYGDVKTILSLVPKDNPNEDFPPDQNPDPQSPNWQAAIDAWVSLNPLTSPPIPQELDDLHDPAKAPKISIVSPPENSRLSSAEGLTVEVEVAASFPLSEVTLFIDDRLIQSRTAPILSPRITFGVGEELTLGTTHTIKIAAYDAVGNRATAERVIAVSP